MYTEADPKTHARNTQDTKNDSSNKTIAAAPSGPIKTPTAIVPGQIRVIKRNGTVVSFDESKIRVALTKAFLAVEGQAATTSRRIHDIVSDLTSDIVATFQRRLSSGGTLHIEDIQDQAELALMRSEHHKVARAYVLYREERARERTQAKAQLPPAGDGIATPDSTVFKGPNITMRLANGENVPIDYARLTHVVSEACRDLEAVEAERILEEAVSNLYEGVSFEDVQTSLVMTARTLIEEEPNYTYVTARLLLDQLRSEALDFLGLAPQATQSQMSELYARYFSTYLTTGIELELISPKLRDLFDLTQIQAALIPDRDEQFTYLGLQTLYDRYFLHSDGTRFELPQAFFMRVAMGLAIQEGQPTERAIEFYGLLSSFDYMSSTPTLFNSGTLRPQLSSCYLTTVPDDLRGIYNSIRDNALLSKWAGGLGNDWTPVRSLGAYIKGTNGKSQGVVPFLKVVNDTAVAVNQGGKRKGAVCAYLETWHLDIEEFLELRKNTGDDRRRTHDMNSANWIPDLFMKRVFANEDWTLFSPSDVPDLHDLYGKAFEERYTHYENLATKGDITLFKQVSAKQLWRKMLSMLFETGHPWITFKDPCNIRSPQQHTGVVHSSNLCTEITLNTSDDEVAVCNLGSVNLAAHINNGALNVEKLRSTVHTAVRMLDNVIDINYYAIPQAQKSNAKHRPVGLGLMGFQDALYILGIPYGSQEAIEFADKSMEQISYFAIEASTALAKERGSYESFKGSLWSKGQLPIDSLKLLIEERGEQYIEVNTESTLDWDALRSIVKRQGIRNSNVMAIAPTATIANITGVTQSIEPTYQNLFVKSNLSGEFTVVNPYLVRALKSRGIWDKVMVNDLKYFDGSVQPIDRIPDDIKALFATAFEVEPKWLVDSASRRQKWIDQSQSLNLYIKGASGKTLDITYRMAWYRGLKTTYYLRALAATSTEKSTVNTGQLNAVKSDSPGPAPVPTACSIDNPDCEACQ